MLNNNQNISDSILNNIDTIIYIYNLQKEVLYLNKKAIKVYGKISNRKCWQFLHKNEKKVCAICPVEYIFHKTDSLKKTVWENFNPYIGKWFENHSQIINYKGKKAILEIAINITDRKKDEKQILTFLNYQNILFDIAEIINSSLDFNKKESKVIENIAKILKPTRVNIGIKQKNEIKIIKEWNQKGVEPLSEKQTDCSLTKNDIPYLQLIKKGFIIINSLKNEFSTQYFNLFKELNIVSLIIIPIFIDKNIYGFICVSDNKERKWKTPEIKLLKTISEILSNAIKRDENEKIIIKNEKELKKANDSKDKFFSIIAHDLKNPVYNVISLADYLNDNIDKWETPKIKEFIKYISKAGQQSYNLLENLLTWAKTQTKSLKPEFANFNILKIIQQAYSIHENSIHKKQIQFSIDKNNEVPIIYADKNMIFTVIRNLLSNAIKYTNKKGTIKIIIKQITKEKEQYQQIIIQDTGVGISEKSLSKLFNIDDNFSTTGTDEEQGSGLGLIICKEFLELNKGEITVESELNVGSKFIITLPKK